MIGLVEVEEEHPLAERGRRCAANDFAGHICVRGAAQCRREALLRLSPLVKQILEWQCIRRRAYYRLGAAPIVRRTRVAHDSLLAQRFKHNAAVIQQMAKYPVQAVATKRQLEQAVRVGEAFGLRLEYAQVPTKRL